MTTPEPPFHLVVVPGASLSAFGITMAAGMLYRIEEADFASQRDDTGASWLTDLSEPAQRARWGRVMVRVVEVVAARAGAALLVLRALEDVPLQGRGRLAAGERLVMPEAMVAQLSWLAPAVQQAAHGHQVIVVEPYEPDED